jgi:hypothetical protein
VDLCEIDSNILRTYTELHGVPIAIGITDVHRAKVIKISFKLPEFNYLADWSLVKANPASSFNPSVEASSLTAGIE